MNGPSRPARVGDLLRQEISVLLQQRVRDPDVVDVTVTHVRVSKDLRHARVFYTGPTEPSRQRAVARALRRVGPFLKRLLAERLRLRYVPELVFSYDDVGERQDRVTQLLEEISRERPEE